MKNNKIILKRDKVKYLLQKYREEKYESDSKYLEDISKINITLDETNVNMINVSLCYKYSNIINIEKKNILDKYIIFTTNFQLNLAKKCTQVLVDGTFKCCPKGYYQVINVAGYYPELNAIIPLFMIPTTGKSYYLYKEIFQDIKNIYINTGHKIEDFPKDFMMDFEKSMIKAIKINFENARIDGCYFHYVKLLWSRAKKYGLCSQRMLKNTKIILFILKILPFVFPDDRNNIFEKLENFYVKEDNNYKKLFLYYKKNWLSNEYINYTELDNRELLNRTNNYIENFHKNLNLSLEVYHPKLSYLISKYANYLKNIYDRIKDSLINPVIEMKEKYSVINDIMSYLKNYKNKYNCKLDVIHIIQGNEDEQQVINQVCNTVLDSFFVEDLNVNDENLGNKEEISDNESEEISDKDIEEKKNKEIQDSDDEDKIYFEPQFKKDVKKLTKKTEKRKYIEAMGEDNDLKKYLDQLKF